MKLATTAIAAGALLVIMQLTTTADSSSSIVLKAAATSAQKPQALYMSVSDVKGTYTIPYIQSSRTLEVKLEFSQAGPEQARVRLLQGGQIIGEHRAGVDHATVHFGSLKPGEYSLEVEGLDTSGQKVSTANWERIGVGTVIGAIGDSITEGYLGQGFMRTDLNLRAESFPPESVSKDGRNFPQYAPTTAQSKPDVNCFKSWMPTLNNLLSERWRQPVFIANEGIGGITSGGYLNMIKQDTGWQARMKLLKPQVWILHLGVNDERAHVPAAEYAANMEGIVETLIREYGAAPECILICRPDYDYWEQAPEILQSYIAKQDELIARRGLRRGPDFFAAYAVDRARWYGEDPVHPNVEGMEYMARLWADALVAALPEGVK